MSRRVEREYETALERTPKRWRRMRDLAHEGWGMTDQMKARRYKDKFSSYSMCRIRIKSIRINGGFIFYKKY